MKSSDSTTYAPGSDDAVVSLWVLVPGKPSLEYRLRPGRYLLGRSKTADISLDNGSVSRSHLELDIAEDGAAVARDLDSSSGTFLAGRRLTGSTSIPPSTALLLGVQRIELRLLPREAPRVLDAFGEATELGASEWSREQTLSDHRGGTAAGGSLEGARFVPQVLQPAAFSALGAPLDDEDLAEAERTSLLTDLPDLARVRLLELAVRVDLPPGATLLRVGEAVDFLDIVLRGEVQLTQGDRSLGSVTQGGAIELLGAVQPGRAQATSTTSEGVTLLRIEAAKLHQVLEDYPEAREFITRVLTWPGAERFRDLMLEYGVARPVVVEAIVGLHRRMLLANKRLNQEGDRATALWILDEGAVSGWKSLDGAPALLIELTVGSLFGGAEVIADRPLSVAFEASGDAAVLELPSEIVLALTARAPELAQLVEALGSFGRARALWSGDLDSEAEESSEDEEGDKNEEDGEEDGEQDGEQDGDDEDDEDDEDEDEDDDEDDDDDDDDEEEGGDSPPLKHFERGKSPAPMRRPRRVFVRQHDEMDCGAACMAMLAQSYGRHISLAYYRSLVHVTREGASMWSLVRAAQQTGLDVVGIRSTTTGLRSVYLPAVLLLQYHFVVLYALTKTHAIIADPGIGIRRIPMANFEKAWSGMALLFKPSVRLYAYPESASGYLKYRVLLRGLLRPIAEIVGASLLVFGFGLFPPLLSQVIFDRVLVRSDTSLLHVMMLCAAAVVLFSQAASTIRTHLTGFVANRFDIAFSALVYRHVLTLPLNYFMVRRVGDILVRFREITRLREFLTGESLNAVIQFVSIGLYLAVLYLYDPRLGNLALALIPLIVATSVLTSGRLERILKEGFASLVKAQSFVVEHMRALDTIKALSAELSSRWRWEESLRDSLRNRFRVNRVRMITSTLSGGFESLATTAMLFYAARLATRGELSVGKVIATGQFVASIFAPVRELAGLWTNLQETKVAAGRIDDIITVAPEPGDLRRYTGDERLAGDIEFRDVWFQYGSDLSPWVLKGVSFTIKRGETVAFVGRSGSGKTTLVQLINLLYRPTRGSILVDGKDVVEVPLGQLRESVGIVMQDAHLFAGTVLDNITFGHEGASIELAMAAARVANAHGFIAQMKGGYSARLGEGGRGLSGGQKQRLNIARALFRRPSILILDEATSALDSESERAVVDAMKVFCRGRTSIIIAHRLSTVLHADRIVMLDGGTVLETGTHRELIRMGGAYAQLFGAQLAI